MLNEERDEPGTSPKAARPAHSGEALFLDNLALIDRVIAFVCRRHHLSSADADDFGSHARLKLMEDGYAVLGKFQGRSSLRTFLGVTIQHFFLDYRISAWGKWRPSAEAVRCGPVAILLEQLTGRDSYSFDEAVEVITTNHRVPIARAELEALAGSLPVRLRRRVEGEEALATVTSGTTVAEDVEEAERHRAQERVNEAVREELALLAPQDRAIVRMRFEDGRTVAEIAAVLRLEPKPLYGRVQRILRDLRAALARRGLGAEGLFE